LLSATDEKSNRGESSEESSARFRHGIESELVGPRNSTGKGASILFEHDFKAELLLGICFWRKVREERVWAEYMGEKGGGVNPLRWISESKYPKLFAVLRLLGNCFWREDLEAGLGWEIVSEPRYLIVTLQRH